MRILEATVKAVKIPVTLKMRMGWDHNSLNAPIFAKRAEELGIQMITIHGRTRCQFYGGRADWAASWRVWETRRSWVMQAVSSLSDRTSPTRVWSAANHETRRTTCGSRITGGA